MTAIENTTFDAETWGWIFPEESPFEQLLQQPYQAFFMPFSKIVYIPVDYISDLVKRPPD